MRDLGQGFFLGKRNVSQLESDSEAWWHGVANAPNARECTILTLH